MEQAAYISENTLQLISLHDCLIKEVVVSGADLILTFGHIDVLADHPLNSTGLSMCTGEAKLRFEHAERITSVLYDTSESAKQDDPDAEEDSHPREVDMLEILEDFEVLQHSEQLHPNGYVHRFEGIGSVKHNTDYAYVVIRCNRVTVEWNEFTDKAWFEGWAEDK
ncbi:hypothetical protein AB9M62_48935 [Bacillales bacterium AN1005]